MSVCLYRILLCISVHVHFNSRVLNTYVTRVFKHIRMHLDIMCITYIYYLYLCNIYTECFRISAFEFCPLYSASRNKTKMLLCKTSLNAFEKLNKMKLLMLFPSVVPFCQIKVSLDLSRAVYSFSFFKLFVESCDQFVSFLPPKVMNFFFKVEI